MATAGRAVVFSGATVAIGLALLLFMPSPFMRSMGIGGFLIPLVSIAAAVTLQPALLSLYGRRGVRRAAIFRRVGDAPRRGFWERLSASIMRRPAAFLVGGMALLVAAGIPVFWLKLTPGSAEGIPKHPQAVHGFEILKSAVGAGALSPTQIVIDSGRAGGVTASPLQESIKRMIVKIRRDPEARFVRYAPRRPWLDPSGRYAQVVVAGVHEYGDGPAQRFVHRLRDDIIPAASWPAGVRVLAGGGPPQGVDFIDRSYAVFPWLVLGVLVLTYLLLLRAFRSLLLPLKAVLLNLLSVGAAYGALVVVFKWGLGKNAWGLYQFPQVEAWIPIFLFAMLFGLSMDYEVFLVSRMREAWDETKDNVRAVGLGLERTGRIVTAAAIVMVAAFSGFIAGRVVGLQEFGFGLAIAIFVDATIVRALLVPSLMAIFGRWNWWLPGEGRARHARARVAAGGASTRIAARGPVASRSGQVKEQHGDCSESEKRAVGNRFATRAAAFADEHDDSRDAAREHSEQQCRQHRGSERRSEQQHQFHVPHAEAGRDDQGENEEAGERAEARAEPRLPVRGLGRQAGGEHECGARQHDAVRQPVRLEVDHRQHDEDGSRGRRDQAGCAEPVACEHGSGEHGGEAGA